MKENKLNPFVFTNKKDKSTFKITSILGDILSGWKRKNKEIPLDHVGVVLRGGKIVAYFRQGGVYIDNPMYKIESQSNKNIELYFNKKGSAGDKNDPNNFGIGTASPEQSQSNKTDFIELYSESIIANKTFTDKDLAKVKAEEVWDKECGDKIMDIQVMLYPRVELSLEIDIDHESSNPKELEADDKVKYNCDFEWQKNIQLFFKNVPGQNETDRKAYIERQVMLNVNASLNEVYKKFTYGQITALVRVNAISPIVMKRVLTLNQQQELGLKIRSATASSLQALSDVHDSQIAIAKAQNRVVESKLEAEASKITEENKAQYEAFSIKEKGMAEAEKNKALNKAAALLVKLTKLAEAEGAEAMNAAEIKDLKELIETATSGGINATDILNINKDIEIAKNYSDAQGTIIIKDSGSGNSNAGSDNTVSTVLLLKTLKELGEKIDRAIKKP